VEQRDLHRATATRLHSSIFPPSNVSQTNHMRISPTPIARSHHRTSTLLLLFFCCAALTVASADAQEHPRNWWPEFRGPHGNGYADSAGLPVQIQPEVHVRWETPIHGKGWSSPVVYGDQIWLTTATEDGREMSALAIELETGKVLRDVVIYTNAEPAFCHPSNSYATPTPAIEAGRVFLHYGSYGTVCLDTQTGEKIWERRDLPCDHYRGPASSPILHGNLLIVAFDGFDLQYVVALNKMTGETVWRTEREINYNTDNGDLKKAYGTASVIEVSGREQLICPSAVATEAFDPASGERLWTVYHEGMNASLRPVAGHGLVFLTNGMGSMVAVRPDGKGNITDSHIAWSSTKSVAKKASQLLIGNDLYMIADSGILSRRDAVTGEIDWQERLDGEFAASPIYAGGLIYLANEEGAIYVVRPGDAFELVASATLGDGYMASPAVAGDQLILRSKSRLYCLKNK
jgi:hypothetical protein